MEQRDTFTLINPQTNHLAFKLSFFNQKNPFEEIQRLGYYSLIWIKEGSGTIKADFSDYEFAAGYLCAFSPHQPFVFDATDNLCGLVIHFHPDFFCIHKHQKEVACDGVLFNNIYNPPILELDQETSSSFDLVVEQIKAEMQNPALAQYELLVSYLKIFLIKGSRLKSQQDARISETKSEEPFILQNLRNYIEAHYKTKHSASDYADMLAITPKALGKLTKTHFDKTLTDLIADRIIIEAKRELYLTNKTVKEIAYELGYNDEYYFSRFFKKNTDVSPQVYRETVGFDMRSMA